MYIYIYIMVISMRVLSILVLPFEATTNAQTPFSAAGPAHDIDLPTSTVEEISGQILGIPKSLQNIHQDVEKPPVWLMWKNRGNGKGC